MELGLEDKGLVGNLVAFDQEASAVGIHIQVEVLDQEEFDPKASVVGIHSQEEASAVGIHSQEEVLDQEASVVGIHNQEVEFTAVSNQAASGP